MRSTILFLFAMVICAQAWAADEFAAVKCGADIPKAIVGKRSSNERVAVLETRHKDLGLKDLGGIEISDRLFLVSWRICGNEYAELINTEKEVVRDVLAVPAHSLHSPESFAQECQVGSKKIPDAVLAILDNRGGRKSRSHLEEIVLPAKIAWKIDERQERFVPMTVEGLSCAVSGLTDELEQ